MKKVNDKNMQENKVLAADKKETSLFEVAGLGNVEKVLHKIPLIGKVIPFLFVNLIAATIFYYLCYGPLWLFSSTPEEDGQWFVRRIDMLGKSHSRLTTHAAEQVAFFVAGFAACLFTFANFKKNDRTTFIFKAVLISLIPFGLLLLIKVFDTMDYYIPMGFVYGQFIALAIVCLVKLFKGDKMIEHA